MDELQDGWLNEELEARPDVEIRLAFKRRDDGGLRVWSDDVPGLILSGADRAAVVRDIGPALAALLGAVKPLAG
jgi:hypothetical protein